MRKISRIIFWISLVLIFLFVFLPIIGHFTPFEYTNTRYKLLYEKFRFYGLPIVILFTLFGTLKSGEPGRLRDTKVGWTILASIFSFIILFFTLFADMCRWTDSRILFERRGKPAIKIVLRSYGCGALDGGPPAYKIVKIRTIMPSLISATSFDTTKIDKTLWRPVDRKE